MNSSTPALNRRETRIPVMLLDTVPEGRYAVRQDETKNHVFLRVSRPTKGKFKDCLKVMTQHSETYVVAFVIYPNETMYWFDMTIEDGLLSVVLNPQKWAREYGLVVGRCCSCGKELTDPRSRYYSIGPECEKSHEDIIEWVDEQEGPYGS